MAGNYDQPPEVVSPLTLDQLMVTFAAFMRSESDFLKLEMSGPSLVTEDLFTDPERFLYVAWKCYAEVRKTTKAVPHPTLVVNQIRAESVRPEAGVPAIVAEQAERLVTAAYSWGYDHPTMLAVARDTYKRFYTDRVAVRQLQRQLIQPFGLQIADPRRLLREAEDKLRRADVLTAADAYRVKGRLRSRENEAVPTGVAPWDKATGGGLQARQIYGLFGPSGAFKTGLAVQLMCGLAKSDYLHRRTNNSHVVGQSIYFAYECSKEEIEARFISCAAEIPYKRVCDLLETDHRGRIAVPHLVPQQEEYEDKIDNELKRMSEQERIDYAFELLAGVAIFEMGGGDDTRAGKGYVAELSACVESVRQQTGAPIQSVFVDYAKLMARRYNWATASNSRQDQGRMLLSQLPDLMRAEVADKYRSAVVILQQLDYQANMKKACSLLTHSMSSEAKDLGENMGYCVCLSALDKVRNNMTVINVSKSRHTAGTPAAVYRLDGNRSKLVPAEGFSVDLDGRLIDQHTSGFVADATAFDDGMFTAGT